MYDCNFNFYRNFRRKNLKMFVWFYRGFYSNILRTLLYEIQSQMSNKYNTNKDVLLLFHHFGSRFVPVYGMPKLLVLFQK